MMLKHNHGSQTVDPLKQGSVYTLQLTFRHNHGSQTVDPLKRARGVDGGRCAAIITTVLRPWTH